MNVPHHPHDALTPIPIGRPWLIGLGGVTAALLVASAVGGVIAGRQFAFSVLTAFVFAVSLCVGALFWVMIHHVTGAGWSVVVRRVMEHLAVAVVPVALLVLPVLLMVGSIYDWAGHHTDGHDHLAAKRPYLNVPFFVVRTAVYLGAWSWMAWRMWRWSIQQDSANDWNPTRRLRFHSPTGLIVLGLTTTFAAFDWIMSLEPHWFSTIFGVYFWAGAIVGSLAALTLIVLALRAAGHLRRTVTVEHLHDLGKLLFAFTIFWAYIAFSQYFLIWYANLTEETPWYLHRLHGSWRWLAYALPVGHFVVPFVVLLPRAAKRNPVVLALVAGWLLLFHYLDLYWQVMPVLHRDGVGVHWLDATAALAALGVVGLVVAVGIRTYAPVPVRDPRLAESLALHND